MKTVAVIGGGITGMSTVYFLNKRLQSSKRDVKVILIEANDTLGGKINTRHDHDFMMETGADSIVTRKQNVAPLIEELGLQEEVVYNATGKSFIYIDGKLMSIPEDTVFGIPLSLESLAKSDLISAEGKVEALKDFYTKNESFTKNDSVGAFLENFLGKELVERQISPVLSGVYSGKLSELTIASTLPYLLDYKNEYGSIIQGLSENKKLFQSNGSKKFLSFTNGVSALIDKMEEKLPNVTFLKGVKAERLEKTNDRYRITLSTQEAIDVDLIVLSTLHSAAQAILQDDELDKDFKQLKNSSLISVYLGFDVPDHLLPENGTGFISADNRELKCDACTWTSRKWEHTSKQRNLLVRLFYKSSNPNYPDLLKLSEEGLLKVALDDIAFSLGLSATPVTYDVTKWHETMPNYHIKHHEIVQSLERKLEQSFPGVILAGCSYYGVGIPDCVANGEKSANWAFEQLTAAD
ncbi:protoporphyrinogen oxidase [Paenibacillus puerhi]|uniref:protoporphyrinogen oxidase n=1 Tax=Paenibacillus puerhi TaxID=2692622 RepID=UPI00135B6D96|nr:protoporphyrinogen oxidase [Paenibacillus puerhi]